MDDYIEKLEKLNQLKQEALEESFEGNSGDDILFQIEAKIDATLIV